MNMPSSGGDFGLLGVKKTPFSSHTVTVQVSRRLRGAQDEAFF